MIQLDHFQQAFSNLPTGVDAAELNAERIEETSLSVESGELIRCKAFSQTKLYLRATAGRTGMVYTEKLDESPEELIHRAAENARYSTAPEAEPMHKYGSCFFEQPREASSVNELKEFCAQTEAIARSLSGIAAVIDCTVLDRTRENRVINSYGFRAGCSSGYAQAELTIAAKRDGEPAIGTARISSTALSNLDANKLVKMAAADAALQDGGGLRPHACVSGTYDAVLTGRVMRNILMTAWMSLSKQNIARGASPYRGASDERIGSGAFSVVNAPKHAMLGQIWQIDSEGTQCKETVLVSHGRLIAPLTTLSSGNCICTGSAGRVDQMTGNVPIRLTTVPANLYVVPGATGDARALAREMGTGLLVTYSLDLFHSVNVFSGEFSIPCGGVWYQNGEPVGTLSQATMAGNVRDLWAAIERVGADLDFDEFYFKTYCIGSPSALVRGITFGC